MYPAVASAADYEPATRFWEIPAKPPMPDRTVPYVRSFLSFSGFYYRGNTIVPYGLDPGE
jgi:hypothetical protein